MKTFLMWSGGKDSGASIAICHQHGIPLDGVIFSEVMFDHSRGISGEIPVFIDWIYNHAIPIIRNMGYEVFIVKDKSDYIQEFFYIPKRTTKPERAGKHAAFFIGGRCVGNRNLKMRPIREFLKSQGDCVEIVGIAADEKERLSRLKARGENKRSVLAEYGISEDMAYELCRQYDLLSPIYQTKSRGGCWFCPNQGIKELYELRRDYPHLWNELVELSKAPNLISYGFKYGKTVQEVEAEIDQYAEILDWQSRQMTFYFDFKEEA